ILTLNEAGFVVAADDHVGHGKTAFDSGNWSDWGDKGHMTMAEDEHTLRGIVQEAYPDIPYFMFGHSMGSMIARIYAAKYGEGMAGLIICGTSGVCPVAKEVAATLKNEMGAGTGEVVDPKYVDQLLGWMTVRIEALNTHNDWVSSDHANDPFNNFTSPPNVRSLHDFAMMMVTIVGTEWAEKVPAQIPVYNIAGDQDPVGGYGEGVYAVSNWLTETGHDVTTKLYSGFRHEIHNHRAIRDEVESGIIEFMIRVMES